MCELMNESVLESLWCGCAENLMRRGNVIIEHKLIILNIFMNVLLLKKSLRNECDQTNVQKD